MKSVLSIAMMGLFATSAHAGEVLSCSFTEPFINYTWNAETKMVTRVDVALDYNEETGEFIPKELGIGEFACSSENERACALTLQGEQEALVQINADFQGSDGMSDLIYPFSATIKLSDDLLLFGGCSTTSHQPIDPTEIIGKLTGKK